MNIVCDNKVYIIDVSDAVMPRIVFVPRFDNIGASNNIMFFDYRPLQRKRRIVEKKIIKTI